MNIIDSITEYLNRFMVFSTPDQARVIALWVLHTWTFSESFPMRPYMTPYLYVNSLEPASGKTTLIDLLEPICLNSERGDDMTSSVMFRLIESRHPTMFVDEVDTVWNGAKHDDLRRVINSGYKRSGYVWRNAPGPDGPEPTKFGTFAPKVLAGLDNGDLPETVATRSIEIMLERVGTLDENGTVIAPDGTPRETYYGMMAEEYAEQLIEEIAAFMATWKAQYEQYMPKPMPGIKSRQWELAFPLIQVAKAAGIEDEARESIKRILTTPRPKRDTADQRMLRAIRECFDETGAQQLHSSVICQYLSEALGEGWTGKHLNNRLRPYDVGDTSLVRTANRTAKGYKRHQFEDAWRREL